MKKSVIGFMVLVMCSGALMSVEDVEQGQPKSNLNSFMGLQFGSELKMTRAEMFSSYPELEKSLPKLNKKPDFIKEERGDKKTSYEYAAKRSELGNILANIYLYFTELPGQNPLLIIKKYIFTTVLITFDSRSFNNCKEMLIIKYGQPTTIQATENRPTGRKFPMSQSLRWDLKDIKIKIIADEYSSESDLSAIGGPLNETQPWSLRSKVSIDSTSAFDKETSPF